MFLFATRSFLLFLDASSHLYDIHFRTRRIFSRIIVGAHERERERKRERKRVRERERERKREKKRERKQKEEKMIEGDR